MLQAIIRGKTNIRGKTTGGFRINEDLLTAIFFGRLPYLSEETQTSVLEILTNGQISPDSMEDISFWPRLDYKKQSWVEPDIKIECHKTTIIIEVKRPPSELGVNPQLPKQWESQLVALSHERRSDESPKPVIFVALGGTEPVKDFTFPEKSKKQYPFDLRLVILPWETVYEKILKLEPILKSDRAVVADWCKAFDHFPRLQPPPDLESVATLVENFKAKEALDVLAAWAEPTWSPFDHLYDFAKTINFQEGFKWL